MCIYMPSVKLHSWKVVAENSNWSLKSPGKMVAIVCTSPDSFIFLSIERHCERLVSYLELNTVTMFSTNKMLM